ncbi:hypothetical protein ACYSNW_09560 [Enterococcus sp. LJL99]
MKQLLKISFSLMIVLANLLPVVANASPVVNGTENTPIQIELVESPLRLSTVQAPTFGSYELTGVEQQLQATGDLSVKVADRRESKANSWGLQYELAMFTEGKADQKLGNDVRLTLGSGTLLADNQTVNPDKYDAQVIALQADQSQLLLQVAPVNAEIYEYRIQKEDIYLMIPSNRIAGKYQAIQTITLIDLPVIP